MRGEYIPLAYEPASTSLDAYGEIQRAVDEVRFGPKRGYQLSVLRYEKSARECQRQGSGALRRHSDFDVFVADHDLDKVEASEIVSRLGDQHVTLERWCSFREVNEWPTPARAVRHTGGDQNGTSISTGSCSNEDCGAEYVVDLAERQEWVLLEYQRLSPRYGHA